MTKELDFEKTATRVSLVSVAGNTALSLFKLLAGVLAHSGAMISDAVHSASDVISSFIVIVGVKIAAREADREHPYGHERFECVAAIVLAVVLAMTGLLIGWRAAQSIGGAGQSPQAPGLLALVAAIVSYAPAIGPYVQSFAAPSVVPSVMRKRVGQFGSWATLSLLFMYVAVYQLPFM